MAVARVVVQAVGRAAGRMAEMAVARVVVQAVERMAGMAVARVVGTAIERMVAEAVDRVVERVAAGWLTCCLPCLNRWRTRSWSRW
jgi:hypothetical protein